MDLNNKLKIISIIENNRKYLPKQKMLSFEPTLSDKYKAKRFNLYSAAHVNTVLDQNENLIMETGFFKYDLLSVVKIVKPLYKLYCLDYRESTWFYIPKKTIVPKHIDESTAGTNRDREHLTISLGNSDSKIILNNKEIVFDCEIFCPTKIEHSVQTGNQDLYILQIPIGK